MITVVENYKGLISYSGLSKGLKCINERYSRLSRKKDKKQGNCFLYHGADFSDGKFIRTNGTRSKLAENARCYFEEHAK